MTWPRATFVLAATCVILCGWIYLRDRHASVVAEPQRVQAQLDANRMLTEVTNASCTTCTADVLGKVGSTTWRVRLLAPKWRRCFVVDVAVFGQTAGQGFSGLRAVTCSS